MSLPRSARRLVALTAAALVVVSGTAVADIPSDDALPGDVVRAQRYQGEDRYETAARTALQSHPSGADTAIIARGDAFPDGLAASYLAGAEDAPILLTAPTEFPFPTQDALEQLGARDAILIGGPSAISQDVEDELVRLLGGKEHVERVAGQTRFETAAYVFNRVGTAGTLRDLSGDTDRQLTTAVVASGRSFPDALAAGPLANAAGVPILLTEPDSLPEITRIAIDTGIEQILVAGGPVSIAGSVVDELRAIDRVQVVHRVSGPDRTATAARLAEVTRAQLGWPAEAVSVALGTDFPDALSLAPAAADRHAPILLTRSSTDAGASTFASVQAACDTLTDGGLTIAGGPVAVGPSAERQLELATSCADLGASLAGSIAGSGQAWVWSESLCYAIRVRDLAAPATRADIRGADGSVAAVLEVPSPATADGLGVGCLTDDDVRDGTADDLRAALAEDPSQFTVVVRTDDGAIRGQLG